MHLSADTARRGQLLVAEADVFKERDICLVALAEVLCAGVGGCVAHRVDLLGREPDLGLLIPIFRMRLLAHLWAVTIYCQLATSK